LTFKTPTKKFFCFLLFEAKEYDDAEFQEAKKDSEAKPEPGSRARGVIIKLPSGAGVVTTNYELLLYKKNSKKFHLKKSWLLKNEKIDYY
jgi:hypothetical protein